MLDEVYVRFVVVLHPLGLTKGLVLDEKSGRLD